MKFTLIYFYSSNTADIFHRMLNVCNVWRNRSMANGFHEFLLLKEDERFAAPFVERDECSVSNMKMEIAI